MDKYYIVVWYEGLTTVSHSKRGILPPICLGAGHRKKGGEKKYWLPRQCECGETILPRQCECGKTILRQKQMSFKGVQNVKTHQEELSESGRQFQMIGEANAQVSRPLGVVNSGP